MPQSSKVPKQLRRLRYSTKTALILVAILGFGASHACAQQLNCRPWNQVPEYRGTITVDGSGTSTTTGETITINESATISFDAITGVLACDSFIVWPSQVNVTTATYSINDTVTSACPGGGSDSTVSQGGGTSNLATIAYFYAAFAPGGGVFNFLPNTYSVRVPGAVVPGQQTVIGCDGSKTVLSTVVPFGPPGGGDNNNDFWIYNALLKAALSTLSGATTIQSSSLPGLTWNISWNIVPVQNFDVVVTIPGYDTWRPSAGNVETDTGLGVNGSPGFLPLNAALVDSISGQSTGVTPDKVTFSLADFSHEPGVSMNWPPAGQAVQTPDLTFDPALNPPSLGFTISPNGTTAVFDPNLAGVHSTTYPAFLSPHDWGAWGTLNVTITVSGFDYQGQLQLADGQKVTNILIPKSQPGSHIADIWKTQNNIPLSTPDSDDSETDPDGLPGCVGDGLTLYEEYRGFMENGKHIEGDPHKKDFFVQNLIGADAEPGIWLFTKLTHLNVHKDIQKSEMDGLHTDTLPPHPGTRLINFNHGNGAHEVDQHGVYIRTCRYTAEGETLLGGDTGLSVKGVRGRPGITNEICLQPRDALGTLSLNPNETHRGLITVQDALVQYDVGIAHELLHSVGVEHHGELDYLLFFHFLAPDNPNNPTGQPLFRIQGGQTVRLLDEQTGVDEADTFWQKIKAEYARCQTITANPSAYPPDTVESCNFGLSLINQYTIAFYVGLPRGKFSGNDQCVMRYFWVNAYPSVADSTVYYQVPAGTEPLGASLCNSPIGTGINDPNRDIPKLHPQPRYFNAADGRGACQQWVCVNDKNPPAPN